jgi:hypothetical protein
MAKLTENAKTLTHLRSFVYANKTLKMVSFYSDSENLSLLKPAP